MISMFNIEELKRNLVNKFGTEPTITYYYYLYNVVNYAGEKVVRESFDSLKKQGNEVILGCYMPKDNTEDLAKEYGFRFIPVEEDSRNKFPESKIRNKIIVESKSNFLVPVNVNVVYYKKLTKIITRWLESNNVTRNVLNIRYKFQEPDGSVGLRNYGFSYVFYKPYLLHARGYDEKTSYAAGSQVYGVKLLKDIFNLRTKVFNSDMFHVNHNHRKIPMYRQFFPNKTEKDLKRHARNLTNYLITELKKDYNKNRWAVSNSYW